MRGCKSGIVLATYLLALFPTVVLSVVIGTQSSFAQAETADASLDSATSDPLSEGAVLLQADTVTFDPDKDLVHASGNVEVAYDERVLRADNLIFYQQTDKVIATGNVSVLEPSGNVFFADRMELQDKLREGVIDNFSALLERNARLAADRGFRREGTVTELSRATYSACDVCDDEGTPKRHFGRSKHSV